MPTSDIVVQIQQVKAGHRREGHLRPAVRLDHAVGLTGPPCRQPERYGSFTLAPHQEIGSRLQDFLGHRGRKGAAHHHGFVPLLWPPG